MPEGDTIHHAANLIRPVLEGRVPDEKDLLAQVEAQFLGFPVHAIGWIPERPLRSVVAGRAIR